MYLKQLRTFSVTLHLCLVNGAVNLNNEPALRAAEVDDKAADGVLAPELVAFQPSPSEVLPQ